ncbi:hypothetical protein JIG36_42255 [Actinoplanes sp. LDG1-06]|uniref:Uncharacterized protein n=1 Tax=Paractinoplanes ovalisporus TaxID=2810368 RepID=A0ABS2ASG3_9ACTN|nr:hypothetical protein [Actinoplanes ovalisporus]MBM2622146.1 hypothetical protein [Actinoplanes ovalisporus]
MLAASGGGGAGGTPWGLMTVQAMQQYIQNPDTDKHYELLTGWQRSADLINEHRWQVTNYRDNLAAVWPPETNKASEAYINRLNELIDNLDDTYEATIANHDAFARATLSISLAQKDMDEIAREYLANEQALTTFTAQQQNASGQPTPSPSPSGEQPPVAPGRQEELHQRAVTLLSGVSADLAQAQLSVRTPTPYRPGRIIGDETTLNDGGSYTAPPIPPITPITGDSGTSSSSSTRPTTVFPTSNTPTPPAPQPTVTPQPGLVLGGTSPTPVTGLPPTATPFPSTLPTGAPGPITSPGLLPPGVNGFLPGGSGAIPPNANNVSRGVPAPRESMVRPGMSPAAPGLHAMPPGGMIGAPGVGIGQPATARPGGARVNPVGGVIGGTSPHAGLGGRGVPTGERAGQQSAYGQPLGRSTNRSDRDDSKHWDPDNPWQTEEGVAPIVLPAREQRVDPGPAIGLS